MVKPAARKSIKSGTDDYQERRRQEAIQKQQAARRSTADKARQLVTQLLESPDDVGAQVAPQIGVYEEGQPWGGATHDAAMGDASEPREYADAHEQHEVVKPNLRELYAQQLMQPEWMVDIPPALQEEWYVMPRPEGQRCLVVAARGRTTARNRSGSVLKVFQSALPCGSGRTTRGHSGVCVLDCVLSDDTYYVMDLICWKGHPLYDCSAEFRLFWLHTRLEEDGVTAAVPGPGIEHAFIPLPSYTCSPDGIAAAYSGAAPFVRDGFLLLHREARYDAGAVSPLALLWKDAACSRYVLDTDAAGVVPHYQQVVLEYRMDRTVATADEPPVVLGSMPAAFVERMGAKLRAGRLLRFSIREGGIRLEKGHPAATDLHFEGVGNQRRGRADIWTKILFQYKARSDQLTISHILAAAAEVGDQDMADEDHKNAV